MFKKNIKILLLLFFLFSVLFINTSNAEENLDTTPPKIILESFINKDSGMYELNSNEPLSYLKVELRKDLFVIINKKGDQWNMKAKKQKISATFNHIFDEENTFVFKYKTSKVKLSIDENETQFKIEISGPVFEKIKKQKSIPLIVKDVSGNEFLDEFKDFKSLIKSPSPCI